MRVLPLVTLMFFIMGEKEEAEGKLSVSMKELEEKRGRDQASLTFQESRQSELVVEREKIVALGDVKEETSKLSQRLSE